jgi:hypothetical protein
MKNQSVAEPFGVSGHMADGKLHLSCSKQLKSFAVYDASNTLAGIVHGCILKGWAKQGITVTDTEIRTNFPISSTSAFEQLVLGLNGSFLAETRGSLPHRLYPDAGGTIPLVYCKASRKVGSSASMMLDEAEYQARFLADRHHRLIASEIKGAWIPGFLTAHEGIFRLLPNFYLDLSGWDTQRFWPTQDVIDEDLTFDEAVDMCVDSLRGYVNAVCDQFERVAPTLTAGFDTRIILAACRDVPKEKLECITVGAKGEALDQIISETLAGKLGIRHRLMPVLKASPEGVEAWDKMVGHCTREATRQTHPTLWGVGADVMFTGMYGETGRSRLYKKEMDSINDYPLSAQFIAGRVSAPSTDVEVLETLDQWVKSIDWAPTQKVLDLTFNELRFGGWAMAQAPVQRAIQFTLMPMAQFDVQRAFMNTQPSLKTDKALFAEVCERLWPEAMSMGINKFGDYRDTLAFLSKFTKRDHLTRGWRLLTTRKK